MFYALRIAIVNVNEVMIIRNPDIFFYVHTATSTLTLIEIALFTLPFVFNLVLKVDSMYQKFFKNGIILLSFGIRSQCDIIFLNVLNRT